MRKIFPIKFSEVREPGMYLHVEVYKDILTAAGFYEYNPNDKDYPWRSDTGCGDVGSFDPKDLMIGPVFLEREEDCL
jgi:hypothetical protein